MLKVFGCQKWFVSLHALIASVPVFQVRVEIEISHGAFC